MPERKPKEEMPEEVRRQVELLTHPRANTDSKRKAVEALGKAKHPGAVLPLVEMLKDPDQNVRFEAAASLGKIGHPAAIPYLVKAIKEDSFVGVKLYSARALGMLARASTIPHLVKALEEENAGVRSEATHALGKIRSYRTIPHLLKALYDSDNLVRLHAAWALARIGQNIQKKPVKGKELNALQLIGAHLNKDDKPNTVRNAYEAALAGKITKANARLYVKQLRAVKGNVK